MSYDTSYNTYDKIASIDWNGQNFILTTRNEITQNTFQYAYSSDGLSWIKSNFYPNVTSTNPYSTKFIGNKFIVAGNLSSSNLDTTNEQYLINVVDAQYPVAMPTNFPNNTIVYDIDADIEQPHQIVFPKTITLALGNTLSYSFDKGETWTTISNSPFSNSVNDAVWNGKLWVSVGTGNSNTIATSLDGIKWTGRGNYIFSTSCKGIDWSPQQKKYVSVGNGTNVVSTSTDGIYWRGTNTTLFSNGGNDIKWSGKLWVAVGNNGGSGNTIAYSYDALSWQYSTISFQTDGLRIYYDEDAVIWTIYGSDPSYNIATSSDGVNWTLSYSSGANTALLNKPTGLFADASLNLYPGIPYPIYNSASGVNKFVYNNSDKGCACIQPISIACGSGSNSLASSADGIQWNAIQNSLFTSCNKAVWNGKLWAVVGTGSYWVATSYDGFEWTGQDSIIMTECYDVAWNGTYFVAVGRNSSVASLATSPDGITWTSVSISSIFTTRIHAIEWTGVVWLAYGSGTNTTAISSSLDASTWTVTATNNLCVVDCSNIVTNNIAGASSSSYQGVNYPVNAFDNSFNVVATKWLSSNSKYDTCGNYIGASATSGISGEWVQVQLTTPLSCKNYYIVFSVSDGSSIPKSWSFLGSNNGVNWTLLDTFNYGTSTPPSNNWKYPFICLPLDVSGSVATYSYYRIVFTSNFGANYVSVTEVALFNEGTKQLDQYICPIVLKDMILHPTRVLSIDGKRLNIYRITDLSCNFIRSGVVHGGQSVNNIIYGLTTEPTASAFDGINHVVFSISGEVSYLSNSASNTNLNFDNSMNGVAVYGQGSNIYAACYNRKFILVGSTYGVLNENVVPRFYQNNLSSLFTSINGLASNSGYGFVVSPNTIYLRDNERLSLITPKFYDSALSSDTSVSFNVYKS